jgi:hypothetical protein
MQLVVNYRTPVCAFIIVEMNDFLRANLWLNVFLSIIKANKNNTKGDIFMVDDTIVIPCPVCGQQLEYVVSVVVDGDIDAFRKHELMSNKFFEG